MVVPRQDVAGELCQVLHMWKHAGVAVESWGPGGVCVALVVWVFWD